MLNEIDDIIKLNTVSPAARTIYADMKGKMLIEQHEPEKAHTLFEKNELGLDKEISYLEVRGYFSFVLLLITESKFNDAEKLLAKLQALTQAAKWIETLITVKIVYAILYKHTGYVEKAAASLIESLEYASDEKILMPFIYYHAYIKDILTDVLKKLPAIKTNIPKKVIDKLKLEIEKREKLKINISEPGLSNRELDTLRLISEDLSNREIAEKLFISLNTVKTHLKNIFLKLEVDSRSGAVGKAKGMGLL
jgi:LuxR family maltose regulon positive regulatory protein